MLWQARAADRWLAFIGGAAERLLGEDPEPWLGRTDFFERHLVDEERDEVLNEWRENKQQAAKDARYYWTFWGIVGAAAFGWYVLTHYR